MDKPVSQGGPTVFVVDDDISVRESLEGLIASAGFEARTFASARDFLVLPRPQTPCCLILDLSLPDINGLEVQERIAGDQLGMPIIFVTGYGDVPTTVKAMKAGAVEFLTKPFREDSLLSAINQAIEQSVATLNREAEERAVKNCYASLSKREREVMGLVVSGLLNKQVGGELGISEITVKAHRGRVMEKMKAASFADLVNMSSKLDLRAHSKG